MIEKLVRLARAAYQFVLDVKIGYDLGRSWPEVIGFAWSIRGWRP